MWTLGVGGSPLESGACLSASAVNILLGDDLREDLRLGGALGDVEPSSKSSKEM